MCYLRGINVDLIFAVYLTLRLLISYIYGAPSKARNANVVYIYIYIYKTLAFLALLGAPYIYDISSLRVNNTNDGVQVHYNLQTEYIPIFLQNGPGVS